MARIAVIDGHPDPDPTHFVHALANAYAEAAAKYHEIDRIDVATLDFPILRTPEDWRTGKPVRSIAKAQETIRKAGHLAIFYPLWLGDMPALLKAFLEQIARPGFAFAAASSGGMGDKLLGGRSARVVVTMGMPALVYRWYFQAHSVRSLERNILGFVGIGPIQRTLIGTVEGMTDRRRAGWLASLHDLGVQGA